MTEVSASNAVDSAIILFAKCPHFLCYWFFFFFSLSVLFLCFIKRSVLSLVLYYNGILEKVSMQSTQQLEDFSLSKSSLRTQAYFRLPLVSAGNLAEPVRAGNTPAFRRLLKPKSKVLFLFTRRVALETRMIDLPNTSICHENTLGNK